MSVLAFLAAIVPNLSIAFSTAEIPDNRCFFENGLFKFSWGPSFLIHFLCCGSSLSSGSTESFVSMTSFAAAGMISSVSMSFPSALISSVSEFCGVELVSHFGT